MIPELHAKFVAASEASVAAYNELLAGLEEKFADAPSATLRRKQASQAARSVLPNATETRIVVTGNYRAWRHFIAMRATEHADVEIRELAVECLRQLQKAATNVFDDFDDLDVAGRHRSRLEPTGHRGLTASRRSWPDRLGWRGEPGQPERVELCDLFAEWDRRSDLAKAGRRVILPPTCSSASAVRGRRSA